MDDKEFWAEWEALICEREGMVAENKQREHFGEFMPYGMNHFVELAERFRALGKAATETPAPSDSSTGDP